MIVPNTEIGYSPLIVGVGTLFYPGSQADKMTRVDGGRKLRGYAS